VLYPNPVSGPGPVHLTLPITSVSNVEITIYTMSFRRVDQLDFKDVTPGEVLSLPLTDHWGIPLADGLYYVVVSAGNKHWILKLLVLR